MFKKILLFLLEIFAMSVAVCLIAPFGFMVANGIWDILIAL